jgi:hypothetical protein
MKHLGNKLEVMSEELGVLSRIPNHPNTQQIKKAPKHLTHKQARKNESSRKKQRS